MKKIRTIIVEDEAHSREGLKILLDDVPDYQVIATCVDGKEAKDKINQLKPDVVLMDIQMPVITGLDVIRSLESEHLPYVIFITAYEQYAVRAFEINAVDYILKPYSRERLLVSLDRARKFVHSSDESDYKKSLEKLFKDFRMMQVQQENTETNYDETYSDRILLRDGGTYEFINVNDIDWIESNENYVNIHCGEITLLHRSSMNKMESSLSPTIFSRIHKSTIINVLKIDSMELDESGCLNIKLCSGVTLKASRRKKRELLETWNKMFGLKPDRE